MTGSLFSASAVRAYGASIQRNISISENIIVESDTVTLYALVLYEELDEAEEGADTDGDGIPDPFEKWMETDPSKDDTDGDGLSDYDEIYKTGTDPTESDSDGDGVNDGDEDSDGDGIPNRKEIEDGTDPVKADSDSDGINDAEEINTYGTDPVKYDTDGDGLSDGDEILLGLDPLKPSTDGTIADAERRFEQTLSDTYIEESLFQDNTVIPSVKGNVPGNIDKHVTIEETDIYALDDNRAAVGKQVCVNTDYAEGTDLRLTLSCAEDDDRFGFYMICRYEDGEFVPCETKQEGNYIWANVESGMYFVIDAEKLLIDLDIPIEKYKNTEAMTLAAADESVSVSVQEAPSNEVSDEWYEENYIIVDENEMPVEREVMESEADEASSVENIGESTGGNTEEITSEDTAKAAAESMGVNTEESADEDVEKVAAGSTEENTEESAEEDTVNGAETTDENTDQAAAGMETVYSLENAETTAGNADKGEQGILQVPLKEGEHLTLTSSLGQSVLPEASARSGKISGQADIVFVIDTTGSMSGAINNVVSNIDSFVDALQTNHSVKANFALVDYKDITCGEETLLVKNGSGAWYSDVAGFKSKINSLIVTGGGDGPETPIDGLGMAKELDFRQNANKFIILVTDANYKNANNYGIASMDEMTDLLAKSDIVTSVISSTAYESIYHNLYTE